MLRKSIVIALVAAAGLFGIATQALAFDGNRKGFILGAGLGGGLVSFTQELNTVTSDRENKAALATDFRIGYGPNEHVQVYWTSRISWFGLENVLRNKVTIANGMGGLGLSYYVNPTGASAYLVGGIGFSSWATPFESGSSGLTGFGICGGVGYEFAPHLSLEGSLGYGNPNDEAGGIKLTTNALAVRITLNALAY